MAYLNRIATAVPENDVHQAFVAFADTLLGERSRPIFRRMADRSQIERRWSVLSPAPGPTGPSVDAEGFYRRGAFPSTGARMRRYQAEAPVLAQRAVERLGLGADIARATHLIVTSCTGFSAPGLDLELVARCGLSPSIERTVVGFMGCYAAVSALKLARHIVRSDPAARVLVVSLDLCTLHLQEVDDLEQVLTFLVFGDGCAAALVTAEPAGFRLDRFKAVVAPGTGEHITWDIGDRGFDMFLSGQVPGAIGAALRQSRDEILDGAAPEAIDLWAVHPGGRTVLDAVEQALGLAPEALAASRTVLRDFGNMSSPTVLFVLEALLKAAAPGRRGCAMAFGPGLTAETLLFTAV